MRKILLFSLVVMIMASSFVFADNNYIMANFGYRAGTTFSGMDFNVDWIGYFGGGSSASDGGSSDGLGGLFSGLFQSSDPLRPERYTPEYYRPHEYQSTPSTSLFGFDFGASDSESEETNEESSTIGMHVGLSLGSVNGIDEYYDNYNGYTYYDQVTLFSLGVQIGASFRQFLGEGKSFFFYEHTGIEAGYPTMMFGIYGDVGIAWQLGGFTLLAGERLSLGLGATDDTYYHDNAMTPGFAISSVTYAGLGFGF